MTDTAEWNRHLKIEENPSAHLPLCLFRVNFL